MMSAENRFEPKMTHGELAQRLGITSSFLSQLTGAGVVTPTRFGTFPVYSEADFERLRTHLDSPRRGRRSDLHRPAGTHPREAYVSQGEAAQLLGVNARTVARWIELGKLQAWAQGVLRSDVEGLAAQLNPEPRQA